jgi:MATE family multidrug resistance protein
MSGIGLGIYLFSTPILRIFISDLSVFPVASTLLLIVGLFQIFDSTQVITTGALRGLGKTRLPMLVNLAGYWLVGLPVALVLGFRSSLGIYGVWIGLSTGLIIIALVLVSFWGKQKVY